MPVEAAFVFYTSLSVKGRWIHLEASPTPSATAKQPSSLALFILPERSECTLKEMRWPTPLARPI